MNQILTDEEKSELINTAHCRYDLVENVIAAYEAKLREQDPVAWGNQREDPFDSSQWLITYDKPNRREVKPLYLHPMPKEKP